MKPPGFPRIVPLLALAAAVVVGGTALSPVSAAKTEIPAALQPGIAHMFIDDGAIQSQDHVIRTLHQPVKDHKGDRPIISSPSGNTLLAYGTIVFDTRLKKHVMFVQDLKLRNMYRILSADGMNWDQTDGSKLERVTLDTNLGDVPRDKASNAAGNRGIDVFSCYYDTTDAEWPYKGWCWFANWGNELEGIFYVRSHDGKAWERGRQVVNGFAGPGDPSCRTIRQDGKLVQGPGDVTLFSYDAATRRYLGIFKFFSASGVGADNGLRSRAYLWLDRLDEPLDTNRIPRIALLPPNAYQDGDTPFDEYYASTAWRYESMWLGTLKIFHSCGNYPHSSAGCAFFKLVAGRDGLNWTKVPYLNDSGVPEVFMANGKQGGADGQNDGGYMSDFSQGPLRIGDELVFYYSSSSWGKHAQQPQRLTGGGIFRARLRPDGFVSVDKGSVTTRPLDSNGGKDLLVNAVGPIRVEVLDKAGQVLGAARIKGDSIRHAVLFNDRSLGQLAGNGDARLRFTVETDGRLYAFKVQ